MATDRRTSSTRLHSIDWARGLAVLIMILAHVIDAWTLPAEKTTLVYRYLRLLGGFAAPAFLWLAGLSVVLAGERALQQTASRPQAWRRLVQRGLQIFILAFLFRAHSFAFNPGGAVIHIFRVDILNIMGPAIALTGLMWGLVRSRVGQVLALGAGAVAVAMVTPLMPSAAWVEVLPTWGQWYLRPAGEYTVFTLFPWTGFVFAGAATGVVVSRSETGWSGHQVRWTVLAAGAATLGLGLYTSMLPTIYKASSFWSTSPSFFAVRVGILLLALGSLDVLGVIIRRRGVELARLTTLGRSSLRIYWVHVQLAYGWATAPIHHKLNIGEMLFAYAAFTVAMFGLIPLRDRLKQVWDGRYRLDRDQPSVASV